MRAAHECMLYDLYKSKTYAAIYERLSISMSYFVDS